ncbi:MAG: transferrin-binding protein-like solute binding protein, partial [Alphaproteobacteria bacterium]|nr:transferrin-binding protein-like solute binding protein [Alphaproteobacteria bacterium]
MISILITGCGGSGGGGGVNTGGGGINVEDEVTLNLIDTIETDESLQKISELGDASLTEASGSGESLFTLQGLVVQGSVITNYTAGGDTFGWTRNSETILNVSRITLPAVSVNFDADGRMSAVTAYFADQTYTPTIGRNTPLADTRLDGTLSGDYDSASLTVDRSAAFFNFDANYMTHIGWYVEQGIRDYADANILERSYIITGSMIAGIETQADTLPSSNQQISFMGKGRGYYNYIQNEEVLRDATIFDVSAIVDFSTRSLTVSSSNSCRMAAGSACKTADNLNFIAPTLSYAIDVDNIIGGISGNVSLISDSSVLGVLDARFYGARARELGGTFALHGEASSVYYYGAFGAERGGIVTPFLSADYGIDSRQVSGDESQNITDSMRANGAYDTVGLASQGGVSIFTMRGLSVYRDDITIYERAPTRDWGTADTVQTIDMVRLSGGATSLGFNAAGNISSVVAYLNGDVYRADNFNAVSNTVVFAPITKDYEDANVARIVVDRSANFFGFNAPSNYMTYVSWNLARSDADLNVDASGLNDRIYNKSGNMIAGLQTPDTTGDGFLSTDRTANFVGKGRGSYSNANGNIRHQYATSFDVEADVNFRDGSIDLAIDNTCEASNCFGNRLAYLDFATAISYNTNINNISKENISIGNGLTGSLDVRFYGPTALEFGGSFIFSGGDVHDYYYGGFGAGRGAIIERPAFAPYIYEEYLGYESAVSIVDKIEDNEYDSLTAAADTTNSLTMNALAVYRNDTVTYSEHSKGTEWNKGVISQTLYTANVLNPAASLTFDGNGGISAGVIYLANQTYEVGADGIITSGVGADARTQTLSVDRSKEFFGLTGASNYMAYISWDISKTYADLDTDSVAEEAIIYDIDGSMLAGLETNNIPTATSTGTVPFNGKGRGSYGSLEARYDTEFDVTATVNFNASNVQLTIDETVCSSDDCSGFNASMLDFHTDTIPYTGNNISSAVTAGGFVGRLDARFYGGNAREFGGTFAMLDRDENAMPIRDADDKIIGWEDNGLYYYGAFGSERLQGIVTPFIFDAEIKDGLAVGGSIISTGYGSLYAVAEASDGTAFTMGGLSVYQDNETVYRRAPNRAWSTKDETRTASLTRLNGATVSLTFDGSNSTPSVVAYADAEYSDATVDRSSGFFGFDSDYMAYINWGATQQANITGASPSDALTQNSYRGNGMMLAGIDTANDRIPLAATIDFTGKGRGTYADAINDSSYETIFDVTASVDFGRNEVTISSSDTCKASDCMNATESGLDFSTATLSYRGNNISADANADGIGAGALSGQLDARFYGDVAWEFGGSFAMRDVSNQSYYYGVFGAQRSGIDVVIFDDNIANERVSVAQTNNINTQFLANQSYVSLSDIRDDSFTMRGLSVYTADQTDSTRAPSHQLTEGDSVQTISIARLRGGAASLTFDGDGAVSGVTAYADADYGNATADRSSDFFGFDSNYMAYISWNVANQPDANALTNRVTAINGNMLVGVESNTLPSAGSAEFHGKGRGNYGDSSDKDEAYETIFDILAIVNFTASNVTFTSSNSCKNIDGADCDDGGADRVDRLNFSTGTLSYTGNDITGIVNAGTLKGTLDARFYGTGNEAAQELGGTFAVVDSTSYYYGAFGAQLFDDFEPRNFITFSAVETVTAPHSQIISVGDQPLTAAADKTVILQGLSVAKNDNSNYARQTNGVGWTETAKLKIDRRITTSRITSSAVALIFDENGAISGVTAYADADYSNATADRSAIFGFDSDYMAYISWGSTKTELGDGIKDSIYDIDGMMLAGVETGASLFSAGRVVFNGKGGGTYGDATSYGTDFDVTANVDFGDSNVTISSSNTACTSNCGSVAVPTYLNFTTAAISYTGNNISGAVSAGTLAGTLDARFYGSAAQEFGGTFALAGNSNYYYGAFGARRNGVAPFVSSSTSTLNALGTVVVANPQAVSIPSDGDGVAYVSLTAISADADTNDTDITAT